MIVSRQPVPPNERGPAKRRRLLAEARDSKRGTYCLLQISALFAYSWRGESRSVRDFLFSAAGVLPWRCKTCQTRFHARLLPLRILFYAHCANCGNLKLQRISAEHVPGAAAALGRILRLPALRCDPCRRKFFSVRPLRHEERPAEPAPSK